MAARWGAGEDILAVSNMDYFSTNTLDEESVLSQRSVDSLALESAETLETLQGCLDRSILSIFEDAPTGEVKGLDEESEATLLTALTEILDNVDDENLSPFDTLPDSDLLSGHKGREHSPLRKLLCLSRSPPEKDPARTFSTGKSLPRVLQGTIQRSDGEEEEDSLSPSCRLSPENKELLDWGDLSLPLPLCLDPEREDSDGLSVSLGELIRHMHPYCMAVCVEDGEGEGMLPEGGVLLEVVDRGEHGEPILAIPDMGLFLGGGPTEEERGPDKAPEDVLSDNSEHIVVDDEDEDLGAASNQLANHTAPTLVAEERDEKAIIRRPKEESREKSPSRRKKKRKGREVEPAELDPPTDCRVTRSSSTRRAAQGTPQKPALKEKVKEKKRERKFPVTSVPTPGSGKQKIRRSAPSTGRHDADGTLTLSLRPSIAVSAPVASCPVTGSLAKTQSSSQPSKEPPSQPIAIPKVLTLAPTTEKPHVLIQASPIVSAALPPPSISPQEPVSPVALREAPPHLDPPALEPKPKPLSLEQYRRLRQKKKPAPLEKPEDQSTKWPSLPEAPAELPPIPCLRAPQDPRRPNPLPCKKEVEEVKPAWQPMGPGAPPTPEALLAPPAYMVAPSSKVAKASPQSKPVSALPQKPVVPQPAQPSHPNAAATPSHVQSVPSPPQSSLAPVQLAPPVVQHVASVDHVDVRQRPSCEELLSDAPSKTTTASIKPSGVTPVVTKKALNVLQKAMVATHKVPHLETATTSLSRSPSQVPPLLPVPALAVRPVIPFKSLKARHVAPVSKATVALGAPQAKSPTQELIESFTTEIGIEATDLTSLLEQFEETQAKVEQCVPEVSGRAAAVGNSSVDPAAEKTAVLRVRAHDLACSVVLTPPATPPHQMWKPLAPVALLGKSRAAESPKPSPSKVIQIEARPLPSIKFRSKPTTLAPSVPPSLAFMDHDYCLPRKDAPVPETAKRWNVKQQAAITFKTIERPGPAASQPDRLPSSSSSSTSIPQTLTSASALNQQAPLDDRAVKSSVMETPDASPTRLEADAVSPDRSPRRGRWRQSYREYGSSRSPSPRPSATQRKRGRSKRRLSHRALSSRSSDSRSSSSGSRSRSPSNKRYRRGHSESSSSSRSSSSSSSSRSRSPPRRRKYSYSSSRSGSWSRSSSRSPQRRAHWRRYSRSDRHHSPSCRPGYRHNSPENTEEVKKRKEKAIEERRVVYVGRIRGTMTRSELKERFSLYGKIEECTLHFRDHGDNYGFVTYYDTKDAFTAIENGGKLRKPDELPFDLCFGGRRQFCRATYADLDSNREYDPLPAKGKFDALDFDTLLKQAQKNHKR